MSEVAERDATIRKMLLENPESARPHSETPLGGQTYHQDVRIAKYEGWAGAKHVPTKTPSDVPELPPELRVDDWKKNEALTAVHLGIAQGQTEIDIGSLNQATKDAVFAQLSPQHQERVKFTIV